MASGGLIGGSGYTNSNQFGLPGQSSPYGNNLNNGTSIAPSPTSTFGNPSSFSAAASTQASDYDTIMKNYGNVVSNASNNPLTASSVAPQSIQNASSASPTSVTPSTISSPSGYQASQVANPQADQADQISAPNAVTSQNVNPNLANYQQSADVTGSLSDLSNLTQTGGYTPQGIADIRARDISPTRSIYATGAQDLARSRALGGGYSPNFAATQAQMARDESNQIATTDTAANAGIAQNVAANQIQAGGMYAGAAGAANQAQQQAGQFNANTTNQVELANQQATNQANEFSANQGLQTSEANQAAINAINEANANRALQTSQTNQAATNQAGQFNAGQSLQANTANANMINQANQFNAGQTQQNQQFNANNANQTNATNAANALSAGTGNANRTLQAQQANIQNQLSGTQGMQSLYGTTPALTNTFGNQVIQAGQLGQGQQQLNQNNLRNIYAMAGA